MDISREVQRETISFNQKMALISSESEKSELIRQYHVGITKIEEAHGIFRGKNALEEK